MWAILKLVCVDCFPLRGDHIFLILDTSSNLGLHPRYCKCLLWKGKMYFCLPFRNFSSCFFVFCPQFKAVICEEVSLLGAYSDILRAELLICMPFNPFAPSLVSCSTTCLHYHTEKFFQLFTQVDSIRAARGETVTDEDEICHPHNSNPFSAFSPLLSWHALFCHQRWKELDAFSSQYHCHLIKSIGRGKSQNQMMTEARKCNG